MKQIIKKLLLITALIFGTTQAVAGAGHSHTVSNGTIKMNAKNHVIKLANKGKINATWKDASYLDMKQEGFLSKEWIVSFKNDKIKDQKKQTIYIYLTTYGKVKGANYGTN